MFNSADEFCFDNVFHGVLVFHFVLFINFIQMSPTSMSKYLDKS